MGHNYKELCDSFDLNNAYAKDNVTNSLFEIAIKKASYTPPLVIVDNKQKIYDTIAGYGIFYKDYCNENRLAIEHMISKMQGHPHIRTLSQDAQSKLGDILEQNPQIQKLSLEDAMKRKEEIDITNGDYMVG